MVTRIIVLFAAFLLPAAAELPEYYRSVDRLVWVVRDMEGALAGWKKLGLVEENPVREVSASLRFRGEAGEGKFRWTAARFGDLVVDFVQPLDSGKEASAEFRKTHGTGVMALVHTVGTIEEMDREIERLHKLGVNVLQRDLTWGGSGDPRYVLFDTEEHGKYVLGLVYIPADYRGAMIPPPARPGSRRVTQFAFAVKDMDAVSRYWARLGWPEMTVTRPDLSDLQYRGRPADLGMTLGWHRHGKVPYEWIFSVKGPNVYEDHMRKHGEGVHHLAFNVDDMDRAMDEWTRTGFPTSQAGAWGQRGKPGSGRFAYQDTHSIGGIDIELLWNYRAPPR